MIRRISIINIILTASLYAQESNTEVKSESTPTSELAVENLNNQIASETIDSSTQSANQVQSNIVIYDSSKDSLPKQTNTVVQSTERKKGKPNIAVLDFTGSLKHFTRDEILSISNRFETELMNTDSFSVLERRNMDAILQEQDFIQSDRCNSSECRTKVGQLLGVDFIIAGEISKVDGIISLNVKMINVESGSNMKSHVLDIKGTLQDVVRGGCLEMALIFSGKKKPEKDHSVLTVEKPSALPWIIGGLGSVAIGFGTYFVLFQNEKKAEDYTVNTGF